MFVRVSDLFQPNSQNVKSKKNFISKFKICFLRFFTNLNAANACWTSWSFVMFKLKGSLIGTKRRSHLKPNWNENSCRIESIKEWRVTVVFSWRNLMNDDDVSTRWDAFDAGRSGTTCADRVVSIIWCSLCGSCHAERKRKEKKIWRKFKDKF